jgi:hypothetical protein
MCGGEPETAAQFRRRLQTIEIDRLVGACRPFSEIRRPELNTAKQSLKRFVLRSMTWRASTVCATASVVRVPAKISVSAF